MAPRLLPLLALCAALCAAHALAGRDAAAEDLLEQSLRRLEARAGRALRQNKAAYSQAVGGQSASASAVAGPGGASTSQQATGAGSQVQGISQVGQKVDTCQRGPANSAACQTLTTEDRASSCSDIPPSTQFTCAEQLKFGKCDAEFIYMGGYCLKTCNRCGDQCADTAPSGGACDASQCNSTAIVAGPFCLKTCGRCYASA